MAKTQWLQSIQNPTTLSVNNLQILVDQTPFTDTGAASYTILMIQGEYHYSAIASVSAVDAITTIGIRVQDSALVIGDGPSSAIDLDFDDAGFWMYKDSFMTTAGRADDVAITRNILTSTKRVVRPDENLVLSTTSSSTPTANAVDTAHRLRILILID